jgi:type I restriction enzyme S subunit
MTEEGYPVFGANGRIGFYAEYNHEHPTVLITCRGATCGTINVSDPKSYVTGNAMALDELDPKTADLRFVAYALNWRGLRDAITGSAQPQITRSSLSGVEIPLPPLSEQKRIADILDKADAIRRKRQEAVNVFTPLIMACFRDCFGSSPEAAWNNTSFGDLVESTQLGLVRSSKEMSDEHPFPYLRMDALIGDGDLTLRSIKRVQATQEESEQYRLRSRDFLFNTRNSRELVGKTAVWHDEYESPVLFNNNIMRVRFRKEVDPVYMNYLFYVPQMRHLLEQRKSGTTSVFAIYYKNLKDLPIPVPPLELQGRFTDFVKATLQWRVTSCGASTESQHLFDSLVQRAFKGVL